MQTPHDSSDIASLIWADWHEEFGNQSYSDEIRLSVNEPIIDQWYFEYKQLNFVGGGRDGGRVGGGVVGCVGGGIGDIGVGWGEIGGAFGGGGGIGDISGIGGIGVSAG